MNHIEVMKQALERMNGVRIFVNSKEKIKQPEGAEWFEEGIKALEEVIAEAEKQEPVAVFDEQLGRPVLLSHAPILEDEQPLYTHPQPPRKPLTNEQIWHLVDTHIGEPNPKYPLNNLDWIHLARAIEAAHGIKE